MTSLHRIPDPTRGPLSRVRRLVSLPLLALAAGAACGGATAPAVEAGTGVSVTVAPPSAFLFTSGALTFSAEVTGTIETRVAWSAPDPGGGTVDQTGRYVAPATPGTYRVVVSCLADPSVQATALVTVARPATTEPPRNPTLVAASPFTTGAHDVAITPTGRAIVVWWANASSSGDPVHQPSAEHVPTSYAIEGWNGSSWVALVNVPTNYLHARAHVVDLTGFSRVRANLGTWSVLEVYAAPDVGTAPDDIWLLLGDSNTQNNWRRHDDFQSRVQRALPGRNPIFLTIGNGGWRASTFLRTSDYGIPTIRRYLQDVPATYVAIQLGTNDAIGGVTASQYYAAMEGLVQEILAAGKIPVIPDPLFTPGSAIQAALPGYVERMALLRTNHPEILTGPDLYSMFRARFLAGTPATFNDDYHVLPGQDWAEKVCTPGVGADVMMQAWADAAAAVVYQNR